MYLLFFFFAFCAVVAIPLHFLSVEHTKLQQKYGKEKGIKIGEIYGRTSGDVLFLALIGLWFSPQPRFVLPIFQQLSLQVPILHYSIPWIHLILFVPLVGCGIWLLFQSVTGLTRKVSESHRPEKVVATGIYARVRHPQYLGFLSMHLGFSFLLSAWFALLCTPLIFIMLYFFARKEEVELVRDFGKDYEEYRRKVPMLLPRWVK